MYLTVPFILELQLHEDGLGDIEGLIQAIEPLKHNEEELYQNILEVGKECIEEGRCCILL